MTGEVETAKDAEKHGVATRWLREIDLASQHEKSWRERAEKIVKRYRDDDRKNDDGGNTSRFNILYANTEVLKGVMYQRTPVADVRRRFLDKDPVGRQAAQILQRALSYSVDTYDFDGLMASVVEDVLLPGRGVGRVRYIPTMDKTGEQVVYQEVRCEYVEWEMYRESPAKRPSKIRWKAYGELMTRDDLVAAFGDKGRRCALDWAPKDKENENDDLFRRALVWSVWDKKSKRVYFVSNGYKEDCLAIVEDPLNLEGFFPSPNSVYSVTTTNSLIPVPEFIQYQDQAIELDDITERIDALVEQLRVRGIADTSMSEIEKLAKAADGEIIPIEDAARAASIMERGGLEKAVMFWPIETIAAVLEKLYLQREQVKQTIYEITGIADIVRGSTKSSETLGAQELKARYANVRVGPRQKAIANFARDIFRMKAELMSEKFTPEMLKMMTGPDMWVIEKQDPMTGQRMKVDATQEIMTLLRNDKLRGFRVDIETDSTIQPDASEEQKNRVDLLGGISTFIAGIGPAVQQGAVSMDLAKELLSFGVRGFKLSPQLEEALDKLGGQDPVQQKMAEVQKQLEAQFAEREQAAAEKEKQLQEAEAGLQKQSMAEKEKLEQAYRQRDEELRTRELTVKEEAIRVQHAKELAAKDEEIRRAKVENDGLKIGSAKKDLDGSVKEMEQRSKQVEEKESDIKGLIAAVEGLAKNQEGLQAAIVDLAEYVKADRVLERDPKTGRAVRSRVDLKRTVQ